jgi:hypothetical protein
MGYAIGAGLLTVGLLGLGWVGILERGRNTRGANHRVRSGPSPAGAVRRRRQGVDRGPATWSGSDHGGDAGWSCAGGGSDSGGD